MGRALCPPILQNGGTIRIYSKPIINWDTSVAQTVSLRRFMHKLTVCATTSVVRYISKIGLSKCPNNFKVHYSYTIPQILWRICSVEDSHK